MLKTPETATILMGAIAIIVLLFTLILIDAVSMSPELESGTVVGKTYETEKRNTNVETIITGNGGVQPILTTNHRREKFLLMVKTEENRVVAVECEPELYHIKDIGDRLEYRAYKGLFTGVTYGRRGVE